MINIIYFTKDEVIIAKGSYGKRTPKIQKEVKIPLPENYVVDGEIIDMVGLTHLLSSTLKKENMKTNKVIFGIENKDIGIRNVTFPNVKKQQLQAVKMKLSESYIGITEHNYVSYKLNKIESNLCHGFAAIVPTSLVDAYYKLSLNIECNLISVDYMGNILYKNLFIDDKKYQKMTFMISDVDSDEVRTHLYNDGILVMSRSENGTSIYSNDVEEEEFAFDNRLRITDEDKEEIEHNYISYNKGLEELSSFVVAKEVYYKRYMADPSKTQLETYEAETIFKEFREILELLKLDGRKALDFDEIVENVHLEKFKNFLFKLQKVIILHKKLSTIECPFDSEIINIINNDKVIVSDIIGILEKYLVIQEDQKKIDRKKLIKRICQQALNVLKVSDISGEYPDINSLHVNGITLTATEKKLVENNISLRYPVEVQNYATYFNNSSSLAPGILLNESKIGKDIDLASSVVKDEAINRSNYDSIVLGIGGIGTFVVIAIIGLTLFYKFNIYQMENQRVADETFIAENDAMYKIINERDSLILKLTEFDNYIDYFDKSSVNLATLEGELSGLSTDVTVMDLSIDESFMVNVRLKGPSLTSISAYIEKMIIAGYLDVTYSTVSLTEDGTIAMVTFKYSEVK